MHSLRTINETKFWRSAQGKPRTRGLPAPVTTAGLDKEETEGVGGAEETAADMFKPKSGQVLYICLLTLGCVLDLRLFRLGVSALRL